MNSFNAQAVFDGTCFLAMYRLSHQARHRPVLDERKQAIRYPTPEQAKIAAHEALLAELNGKEAYWRGPALADARAEAETKWEKVWHGMVCDQDEAGRSATEARMVDRGSPKVQEGLSASIRHGV